jgi:DNA-binding LytR/AlgR family response regulator
MHICIIEDEARAARRLEHLTTTALVKYGLTATFYEYVDSVASAVSFLQSAPQLDLLFLDIQLADGHSFEIFEILHVQTPVIFTTAYDEYAIRAFTLHSVDYLLKPIEESHLERALDKYFAMRTVFGASGEAVVEKTVTSVHPVDFPALLQTLASTHHTYKSRFLVQTGQGFTSIGVESVAYFFSEHKVSWLVDFDGKKYALDYTMEQLVSMLNPSDFFRVNRQYITSLGALQQVNSSINGKLRVHLWPAPHEEVIVGREKASAFKEWLNQ